MIQKENLKIPVYLEAHSKFNSIKKELRITQKSLEKLIKVGNLYERTKNFYVHI